MTAHLVDESAAEVVVDIDHRGKQRGPREQPRLGGAVGRHRPVVVEMIA